MNYLPEPRGQARQIPMGMYQDLGGDVQNTKAWKLYKAERFDEAARYTASQKKKARIAIYSFLREKGVSKKDLAAFQDAVRPYLQARIAAKEAAARPNYLLWGGVALAVGVGGYFLFFRKKKG